MVKKRMKPREQHADVVGVRNKRVERPLDAVEQYTEHRVRSSPSMQESIKFKKSTQRLLLSVLANGNGRNTIGAADASPRATTCPPVDLKPKKRADKNSRPERAKCTDEQAANRARRGSPCRTWQTIRTWGRIPGALDRFLKQLINDVGDHGADVPPITMLQDVGCGRYRRPARARPGLAHARRMLGAKTALAEGAARTEASAGGPTCLQQASPTPHA